MSSYTCRQRKCFVYTVWSGLRVQFLTAVVSSPSPKHENHTPFIWTGEAECQVRCHETLLTEPSAYQRPISSWYKGTKVGLWMQRCSRTGLPRRFLQNTFADTRWSCPWTVMAYLQIAPGYLQQAVARPCHSDAPQLVVQEVPCTMGALRSRECRPWWPCSTTSMDLGQWWQGQRDCSGCPWIFKNCTSTA